MRFSRVGKGLKRSRLCALLLTVLMTAAAPQALAATMQEAKEQQAVLEEAERQALESAQALEADAANRLAYVVQLEEEAVAVQKSIDAVNRKVVVLDEGIAQAPNKPEGSPGADADAMHRAKEKLLAEKEELGYRLQNLRQLQESVREMVADTETAKQAAEAEAKQAAEARAKTDAAIDDWYARYRAVQEAAGVSVDNLGGDVLQGQGAFQWPMPGYTEMTQYFGEGGDHRGLDIAGSGIYGKSIVAAADGTVAYAGWMGSYGYVVFIDHGNGYQTRYAHMSALGCSVGDTLTGGSVIGYVGSTGNSTGPHLHFEILYDGNMLDPLLYF